MIDRPARWWPSQPTSMASKHGLHFRQCRVPAIGDLRRFKTTQAPPLELDEELELPLPLEELLEVLDVLELDELLPESGSGHAPIPLLYPHVVQLY